MSTNEVQFVGRAEAARILGVSMRTVDRYVKRRALTRMRDEENGRIRLHRAEVNQLAAEMRSMTG